MAVSKVEAEARAFLANGKAVYTFGKTGGVG